MDDPARYDLERIADGIIDACLQDAENGGNTWIRFAWESVCNVPRGVMERALYSRGFVPEIEVDMSPAGLIRTEPRIAGVAVREGYQARHHERVDMVEVRRSKTWWRRGKRP